MPKQVRWLGELSYHCRVHSPVYPNRIILCPACLAEGIEVDLGPIVRSERHGFHDALRRRRCPNGHTNLTRVYEELINPEAVADGLVRLESEVTVSA